MKNLLYYIPAGQYGKEGILALLEQHPEIKFVSLVGVDLAGNDTDEKIPMEAFFDDYESFFEGKAVQTDGSSVVLPGIATLDNARVDIWADPGVNWFIDYNYDNVDEVTGLPVGTLRIPAFLQHNYKFVDSRSILKDTMFHVSRELTNLLKTHTIPGMEHVKGEDIRELVFTTATELEFWVKTPSQEVAKKDVFVSQKMQEQYWQRTHGAVRTAMEQAVSRLADYGLVPEMGHKEVGGVKAKIDDAGHLNYVLEQLEIDWKYSNSPLQTADNELQARIIIREVFRENGLEVTFKAKPITGVAGSGEHTHFGLAAKMNDGKFVNLFSPKDMKKAFLSVIGLGAIMGILKNYEVINPFITSTTDSLNRLKPGFEAPVCTVTSLGVSPDVPSRNRTILCGLIRDIENPLASRFELRSPNPYTNTYTAIALIYMAILDGVRYAVTSGKTQDALEAELSKQAGEEAAYLEKERAYRSEVDVFDSFTAEERNKLFGAPPATVWENILGFMNNSDKVENLAKQGAFTVDLMKAFIKGIQNRWSLELANRLVPDNICVIQGMKPQHLEADTLDVQRWEKIDALRRYIAKDTVKETSLSTRLIQALTKGDFDTASKLQLEMNELMLDLEAQYAAYVRNLI